MTLRFRGLVVFGRAKFKSNTTVTSGNLVVESGLVTATGGVASAGTLSGGTASIEGNVKIGGHSDSGIILCNAFVYPNPGTDWTPNSTGAYLAEGLSAKVAWLPLNFVKVGDEITGYRLVGNVMAYSGATNTLDCALQSVNKATPATTTNVTSGAIAQQTSGGFDALASFAAQTIATDKQYQMLITGTAAGSGHIAVLGAEVLINRKV